ncbi:MAG: UvrD-helicase domain-containing protein [Propionibacteriaceae bacterium]|nr:UvrD-helicase domain-containing protein [Propionibacteriaceae bacterium]
MFDITSDLPQNPLLLEASAGTGKTWTIAALTARFIAEAGTPIEDFLLITFSNKAASELRSKVFQRLHHTDEDLTAFLETGQLPQDPVSALLCDQDVPVRRARVHAALERFDRALICTTHVFCQVMLKELGVLGDWDAGESICSDPLPLIDECATDIYIARYQDVAEPTLDPRRARTIAREACQSALPLVSQLQDDLEFCKEVRDRFAERKRVLGLVTFDDLTLRLRDVLASPATGSWAIDALQERFSVVLVDEFQDTDPTQWEIIQRAFVHAGRATVLIGDPKQSIYGFRSADLQSYLAAARATDKLSLPKNHRSDGAVVRGVQELFGNLPLGDPSITVVDVDTHHGSRFSMPNATARVLIRRGNADVLRHPPHEAIAHDMVRLTQRLLEQARITEHDGQERPLSPSDVAVLVRNRARGAEVVQTLLAAGIPAVFHGQDSVLTGTAAADWAKLLTAMVSPTRSDVVLAAATDLMGFSLPGLIDGGEDSARASVLVQRLAHTYESGGMPDVMTVLSAETDLRARLLGQPDGERSLTDLRHVAELLATAPVRDLHGLREWLRRAGEGAVVDGADARLATDAPSVRVTTMHSAKGLQFGVVLLPEVSDLVSQSRKPFPVVLEDTRHLHVGPPLDYRDATRKAFELQQREEELRLLYVGLTRAEYMTIAWHVTGKKSQLGALTSLLARDRQSTALHDRYSRFPPITSLNPQLVHVSDLDDTPPHRVDPPPAPETPLVAAHMQRTIDQTWRRTSYSGLTAGLHELAQATVRDEPAEVAVYQPTPEPSLALASPMSTLPGGAAFGTLVHAALEELDWRPGHLESSAMHVIEALAPRFGMPPEEAEVLAEALVAVCTTPLGVLADGISLAEIPLANRLPELDFDLPMGERGGAATVGDLATLMAEHLPSDDVLAAYPRHLSSSPAAEGVLRGFLTGSIDAVLLTPSGRHVVVDYKTNRLPTGPGEELTIGHYQAPAMAEAMIQAHYPLQALLYSVALHRFLGWRLPNYDPDRHLGGAGYLFVRGMVGAQAPEMSQMPCGVFTWYPPTALVLAASDLIGGLP